MKITLRSSLASDHEWVQKTLVEQWGKESIVVNGTSVAPAQLSGFIAQAGESKLGLIAYSRLAKQFQIVTISSLRSGLGVGTALVNAVLMEAKNAGCAKVVAVTTHDNERVIGFFKRLGFRLCSVRPGTRNTERISKKSSASIRASRDEIQLEMRL
jgi:DNA-3-methyladenine glycosylase I